MSYRACLYVRDIIRRTSNIVKLISYPVHAAVNISRALQLFFKAALANPLRVLAVAWPYVPVAGCFLSFIIWNNGIVLGDKSMHVAVLHIPQIFYFVGFASAFLLPYICTRKVIATTIYTLTGTFR